MLLSGPMRVLNVTKVAVLGNATCPRRVPSAISWVAGLCWGNPLLQGTEDKHGDRGTWKGRRKQQH